jgi:hypothetical protein
VKPFVDLDAVEDDDVLCDAEVVQAEIPVGAKFSSLSFHDDEFKKHEFKKQLTMDQHYYKYILYYNLIIT